MNWWSRWWKQWFTRQPIAVEADYGFGSRLVGFLGGILQSPSVDALRSLARACEPSCDERTIDLEVFFFHKFLVLQSCAAILPQSVINRAAEAFHEALGALLLEDVQAQSYMTRFIRQRISITGTTLAVMDKVWLIRAREYEEPFDLDIEEFLDEEFREKHPMYIPFKRMVSRFSQNFGETSNAAKGFDALPLEAVAACMHVGVAFGVVFESIGEEMRTYFGKVS